MKSRLSMLAAAVGLIAVTSAAVGAVGGDAEAGKAHYASCVPCHGAAGEGDRSQHAPALAGQLASYLDKQLCDFHCGARGVSPRDTYGKRMSESVHVLPDEKAIADLAAYIASLPAPTVGDAPVAPSLGGNATLGRNLYGSCVACHGARGEGNAALHAPRLDMLQDWYIVGELKDFRDGLRGSSYESHTGPVMTPMDGLLPDEAAMRDVAAYITTL